MTVQLSATQARKRLRMGEASFKAAVDSGLIPVWRTADSGRRFFLDTTIDACARRAGELAAERQAS